MSNCEWIGKLAEILGEALGEVFFEILQEELDRIAGLEIRVAALEGESQKRHEAHTIVLEIDNKRLGETLIDGIKR